MKHQASQFEDLVRKYLAGTVSWETVHQLAVDLEFQNEVNFPPEFERPLKELHIIFLTADENDDPQFRADQREISDLVSELDRLRSDVALHGADAVANREASLKIQKETAHRESSLKKHRARNERKHKQT